MLDMDSLWDRLWPTGATGSVIAVALLVLVKGPKFWASAMFTGSRRQQLLNAIVEQQIKSIEKRHKSEMKAEIEWRDEVIERLTAENMRLRAKSQPSSPSSPSD